MEPNKHILCDLVGNANKLLISYVCSVFLKWAMNKRSEVIGWVLLPRSISDRVQPPLLRMHTNPLPHLSQLKRVVMVLIIKKDSSLLKSAMANVAKFILLHIALNGSYCKVWQFILLQSSTAIVTKCVSSFYFQVQRWLLRIQNATITRLKSEYLSVTSQLTVESRIDRAENA